LLSFSSLTYSSNSATFALLAPPAAGLTPEEIPLTLGLAFGSLAGV